MKKRIIIGIMLLLCAVGLAKLCMPKENEAETSKVDKPKVAKRVSTAERSRPYRDPADLAKEGTWKKKSESKPYPKIKSNKNLVVRVSLKGNRVYIIQNGKVLYTMLSTAGKYKNGKSDTPVGNYTIQNGRGNEFFNNQLNEGAKSWTSWSKDNVYLFHSVPTKANGKYNLKEARKLGRTQGSHGCIRLSLPDAKWFMKHIPAGTKVVIRDE